MEKSRFSRRTSELLLAGVIIARATGYLFSKLGMTGLGIFNLLALRFLIAFVLLGAVFARRLFQIDRRSLRAGLIMGAMYFLVMTAELNGLKHGLISGEYCHRPGAAVCGGAQPPRAGEEGGRVRTRNAHGRGTAHARRRRPVRTG